MSVYYLDASALVKRYAIESGTTWIRDLCAAHDEETSERLHTIFVGEISRVEVASAFARKVKKTQELTQQKAKASLDLFLSHLEDEYQVVAVDSALLRSAADLAERHALRAYDAVQLALAAHANNLLKQADLSLTFVAADKDLVLAAREEGLAIENPSEHDD